MSDSLSDAVFVVVVAAGVDCAFCADHGCVTFGECDDGLVAAGLKLFGRGCSGLWCCGGDEIFAKRDAEYKLFGGLSGRNPLPGIMGRGR